MNFAYLSDEELLRHARATADTRTASPLVAELLQRFEALLDERQDANIETLAELDFTAQDLQDLADALGGEDVADACALLSRCNDNDVPMPDAAELVEAFSKAGLPSDFLPGDAAEIFALLVAHCVTTPADLAEILKIFDLV